MLECQNKQAVYRELRVQIETKRDEVENEIMLQFIKELCLKYWKLIWAEIEHTGLIKLVPSPLTRAWFSNNKKFFCQQPKVKFVQLWERTKLTMCVCVCARRAPILVTIRGPAFLAAQRATNFLTKFYYKTLYLVCTHKFMHACNTYTDIYRH